MKFSPAQLKNLNYKQLAIDHGEKLVLGLVGLMSLLFLINAPWKTESRTPEELSRQADEGQQKLRASAWPETEMKKYSTQNTIGARVDQMLGPVNLDKYSYSTDMIWPLIKRHEPIREPEWLTVEELKVSSSQVIIYTRDKPTSTELAANTAPEELRPDPAANAPRSDDPFSVKRDKKSSGPGGVSPTTDFGPSQGGAPYGGEAGLAAGESTKGFRFNSIVGVVPLRKQAEKIARARNEPLAKALDDLQYLNFQLERQTAVSGPDPWAGPWEPVDINVARDVLKEAARLEVDVVDDAVVDPVFTMPLPERVAGEWDTWATHPRVKEFELTEEGRELSRRVTEELLRFEKESRAAEAKQGPQKGGFADQRQDMRALRREVAGSTGNFNDFVTRIGSSVGNDINGRNLANQMKNKITAAGTLLLFRYFDFDIKPGNAYRYRARLVMQNPSFGLSPDQVVAPFVAEKPTRESDWSNVSNPAVVPEDVKYYLARIEHPRGKGLPTAQFNILQWNEKTGTPANNDKSKAALGQKIGGAAEVDIIAPPTKVDKGTFAFATGDYLVDAVENHPVDDREFITFHADLKIPTDVKARPSIPDKALVANDFGELVPVDTVSRKSEETLEMQRFNNLKRLWEQETKDARPNAGMSAADQLAADAGLTPTDGNRKKKSTRRAADPADRRGTAPMAP